MKWFQRRIEQVRSLGPAAVDALVAVVVFIACLLASAGQDIRDANGVIENGYRDATPLIAITVLVVCAPIAVRRRWPLPALVVSAAGILTHIAVGWPEGALPLAVLYLTFTVASWSTSRVALAGLGVVFATVITLGLIDAPGLDTVGVLAVLGQFTAAWAVGVAMRNRRAAADARLRQLEERAEAARQNAARVVAEERLRIAQELHDVVAHSMSVVAVQAGVGAHVLDDRPDQARAALEAISAVSRSTLTELRRLLGVLRDNDGTRSSAPAPGLADVPHLVNDVRAAGLPVSLHVDGAPPRVHPGIELSAYRIIQEALTNVLKHAGHPTRVTVKIAHRDDALAVEVVDDGRGLSAAVRDTPNDNGFAAGDGSGHGLIGMRERVELWGGVLKVGPAPGGGYRVAATLPYGEPS